MIIISKASSLWVSCDFACLVPVALTAFSTRLYPWGCLLTEQAWNIEIVFPSHTKCVLVFSLFPPKSKSRSAYSHLQKTQFP